MKFYISEDYDEVLDEKEYDPKVDIGYEEFECDLKVGEEMTLYDLDDYMSAFANYRPFEKFELSGILKHKLIPYKLIDNWQVNVWFKMLELIESDDEMEVLESKVKIINIELV